MEALCWIRNRCLRAKKTLGQNFLQSTFLSKRIVASVGLSPEETILEIGCGTGSLTQHLIVTQSYIGVEVDQRLCARLQQQYEGPGIKFLNRDILTVDFTQLRRRQPSSSFKIVGNLPYSISSPILQHLTHHVDVIDLVVVMLQSEVADRIIAEPGSRKYGVLTLIIQYYFSPQLLFSVPPHAFKPQPKVHSKVVRLRPQSNRALQLHDESRFFRFIKTAFSQKRKTLKNCLKGIPRYHQDHLRFLLHELHYPPNVRAEEVSLAHFVELFLSVSNC